MMEVSSKMAHVSGVWIYKGDVATKKITVKIDLKPSGTDSIVIDLPEDYFDCIMAIAQTAADHHEQKVRAQILMDTKAPTTTNSEDNNHDGAATAYAAQQALPPAPVSEGCILAAYKGDKT